MSVVFFSCGRCGYLGFLPESVVRKEMAARPGDPPSRVFTCPVEDCPGRDRGSWPVFHPTFSRKRCAQKMGLR